MAESADNNQKDPEYERALEIAQVLCDLTGIKLIK